MSSRFCRIGPGRVAPDAEGGQRQGRGQGGAGGDQSLVCVVGAHPGKKRQHTLSRARSEAADGGNTGLGKAGKR